ncbi:Uncharacterised protein [Shewanella putrefaciens]|nr:Uncharacterised protein [Shewanella putrefaciens]
MEKVEISNWNSHQAVTVVNLAGGGHQSGDETLGCTEGRAQYAVFK